MAGPYEDRDRKIVPRWRSSQLTMKLGELTSLSVPDKQRIDKAHLETAISTFNQSHTISAAARHMILGFWRRKRQRQECATRILNSIGIPRNF
jgi:hypothetical protein